MALSDLFSALAGGGNVVAQPGQQNKNAMDLNVLSSVLGQVAQAVAPDSVGARLGQAGTQMAQAKLLAQKQQADRAALLQQLDALTGQGIQTQGVSVADDGSLKVTGTAAPRTGEVEAAAPQTTQTAETAQPAVGGQPQLPFFNWLGQ